MNYQVEIVTELDEVELISVMANSPEEAEHTATWLVESGRTHLNGQEVIYARALC